MSSQGAVSSLAYSSGAVVTAASMGYVFGRPTKSKRHRKAAQLSIDSNCSSIDISLNDDIPTPSSSATSRSSTSSSSTITNVSPISPLKRFKLFRSKSKRSKLSPSTYIHPTTVPLVVRPDQLVDDDFSSICSDATSVYTTNDRDRKTLSVPNLPATLQQTQHWDNSPSMSLTSGPFVPRSVTETLHEEDEEDEDWDGDSGFKEPLSKTARISSPSLPISTPPKRHSRCKSLPPTNVGDFSPSLYHRQPTPSENWDDDFDIDANVLSVPSLVEESQVSLRMDISNIRDFVYYIGKLKDLVDEKKRLISTIKSKTTKKWTNSFLRTTSKKVKELENEYKQYWEEVAVIIEMADVAEDNETTLGGGKRVEVDIERIPSERHLKIFKKILVESLGEDAKDFKELFDDDKENQYDYSIPSKNTSKNHKLMLLCTKKNNNTSNNCRRTENFRMSVEVMPSLVDRLKIYQSLLDNHIEELEKLSVHGI